MSEMHDPMPAPPPQPAWAPSGPSGPRASFGQRLGSTFIDTLIGLVAVVVGILIHGLIGAIAYFTVLVIYPIFFDGSRSGQTPGRKAVGIRVVDFDSGGPIGYTRAFIRLIAKIIGGLPCYLGYFWMLWDKEKRTWHDHISKSVVVPIEHYPVSKWP